MCDTKFRRFPQNSWKFVRPKKIAGILPNPKKWLKNLPAKNNRIWPNLNPRKLGQHICLNFGRYPGSIS